MRTAIAVYLAGTKTPFWPSHGQGAASPMALFFDPGQRPLFRDRGTFDPDLLCRHLSQPARLRLAHAVRYTRPILEFLKSLSSETTANLTGTLRAPGNMPEGPDVEIYCESEDNVADRVKAIVTKWIGTGYCKIDDILVLSPHAKQESTALKAAPGWTTSWGPVVPGSFWRWCTRNGSEGPVRLASRTGVWPFYPHSL